MSFVCYVGMDDVAEKDGDDDSGEVLLLLHDLMHWTKMKRMKGKTLTGKEILICWIERTTMDCASLDVWGMVLVEHWCCCCVSNGLNISGAVPEMILQPRYQPSRKGTVNGIQFLQSMEM